MTTKTETTREPTYSVASERWEPLRGDKASVVDAFYYLYWCLTLCSSLQVNCHVGPTSSMATAIFRLLA